MASHSAPSEVRHDDSAECRPTFSRWFCGWEGVVAVYTGPCYSYQYRLNMHTMRALCQMLAAPSVCLSVCMSVSCALLRLSSLLTTTTSQPASQPALHKSRSHQQQHKQRLQHKENLVHREQRPSGETLHMPARTPAAGCAPDRCSKLFCARFLDFTLFWNWVQPGPEPGVGSSLALRSVASRQRK